MNRELLLLNFKDWVNLQEGHGIASISHTKAIITHSTFDGILLSDCPIKCHFKAKTDFLSLKIKLTKYISHQNEGLNI